jgi:hypothetical protein
LKDGSFLPNDRLHKTFYTLKRKAPAIDDLFYPSQGMGGGYWSVHLDKATAWLIAKNK